MSRKYEIKVDRSGRGRSFTIINKETGAVVGTTGIAKPGTPVTSAATIRKKEPPKPFVLPKKPVVADDDEDDGNETEANDVAKGVISGTTREERMKLSLAKSMNKKR